MPAAPVDHIMEENDVPLGGPAQPPHGLEVSRPTNPGPVSRAILAAGMPGRLRRAVRWRLCGVKRGVFTFLGNRWICDQGR